VLEPCPRTVGWPSVEIILKLSDDIVLPPDDMTVVEILKDVLDISAFAAEKSRQNNTVSAIIRIFRFTIFLIPS